MTVLYFGTYDPSYARNRILIEGLQKNGVRVLECRDGGSGFFKFVRLFLKHRKLRNSYDVMVVGFLGQQIMPFARLITRKPIVFDAFLSLYDSNVFDRKKTAPSSLRARYYWFLDWISMKVADIVLFDTEQHIDYAVSEFGIKKDKFRKIWIGAQDDIFQPTEAPWDTVKRVVFYGSFIPLQGIQYILKAAKLVENQNIEFDIIGNGQTKKEMLNLADSLGLEKVRFYEHLNPAELASIVSRANICLGIFGDTAKTKRVIPNKVYECLASKKPVITADTPAIRELFSDSDMMLVPVADPEALARAINILADSKNLADQYARRGYDRFVLSATPLVLGAVIKEIIYELKG